MAISEINAALDVISKVTKAMIGIRYQYKQASEEIQAFPQKVKRFTEKRSQWEQLLEKYSLPPDHSVITGLKDAVKILDEQVQDVEAMQKSNGCCRVWNKTWSSDTLITNLRGVDNAFNSIFECLKQKQQEEQAVEQEADKIKAPFSFIPDKKYVPIKQTVAKICRALEADHSGQKVVLLSGGSGEGKSTLGKYLALHYHKKAKGGSTSSNSCRFLNGVIFLPCGQSADSLSLMQKLSEDLGYHLDASKVRVQMDGGTEKKMNLDDLKRKLICRLENGKSILIILDDVWDQQLIADLMIPLKDVTYLITSQLNRQLWTDAFEYVLIDSPTADEAREILANHIVGWNRKPFPPEVQGEVDHVIENVQKHPLILANLATAINWKEVQDLNTWIRLRKDLNNWIQLADEANVFSRPIAFGEPYKRNLVTSLTMAINWISHYARSLLFMLAICTADGVPENVLRFWFKVLHGPNMSMFNGAYVDLRDRSLISVAETRIPGRVETRTMCSIHDLRRGLIRERNEEIEDTFQKLLGKGITRRGKGHVPSNRSEEDLATALCFVYSDVTYSQKAQSRIEVYKNFPWGDNESAGHLTDEWLEMRTSTLDLVKGFSQLIHPTREDTCDREKETHQLAKTVILHLLQFTELKDEAVLKLLDIPRAFSATCSALMHTGFYYDTSKIPMTVKKLVEALNNFVDVPPEFVGDLNICLSSVLYCTCQSYPSISWTLVEEPDLLNVLRKILLWPSSGSVSNDKHPYVGVLDILVRFSKTRDCRRKVAAAPEMLKTLLHLLGSNFHKNRFLLERSIKIFLKVACSDADVKASTIHLPGVFETLVGLLTITPKVATKALEALAWNPHGARLVASCPGALEGLVDLLADTSQLAVRCTAVHCLGVISSFWSASTCPRAVQSLIQLVHQDSSPELLAQIAKFIRKIISDDTGVKFGISEEILTKALQRLYLLVEEDVDVTIRSRAMGALGTLALDGAIIKDLEAYPELPEFLIKIHPSIDVNDGSIKIVNNAFRKMFQDKKGMGEPWRMALGADAVKLYTELLQADDIKLEVQRVVAERLGIISRMQEFHKVVADIGAGSIIIIHMKKDPMFYISETGTHVVEDIVFEAAELMNLERSALVSQVLEFYIAFLRGGFEIQKQEDSIRAIVQLACWQEIRKLLKESDETIELLLEHVKKTTSPFILECVAKIIHGVLCTDCDKIQRRTLETNTLRRYASLLGDGIKANVQEAVVVGFLILGSREEICNIISADEKIVNLLLGILVEDTPTNTLCRVAYLLQKILVKGLGVEESQRMAVINRAMRCFEVLLADGIKTMRVHAGIVRALGSFAFTDKSNKVTVAFPDALNQLTQVLNKVEDRVMMVDEQVCDVVELASACEIEEQDLNKDLFGLKRYFLQCYMSIMEEDTNELMHYGAARCLVRLLKYETNRKLFASVCPDGQAYLKQYAYQRSGRSHGCVISALTLIDPIKTENIPFKGYSSMLARGTARAWLKQYKSSLEDFNIAIMAAPKVRFREIHATRSYIKGHLGDFRRALENFNHAICTSDVGSSFHLQERGILKYMIGDYSGALSDLNESLRLSPEDYEILKHRGYVKFCLGDEAGAKFDTQQALCKYFKECTFRIYANSICLGALPVKYLQYDLW